MQAGCSDSSDLHVESACHPRSQPARYYYPQSYEPQGDAPVSVSKSEFETSLPFLVVMMAFLDCAG